MVSPFFYIKYENVIKLIKFSFSYLEKVLAQLNLVLVSKSDTSYSDIALRALFRLNNHNHVINALRRSSLMELLLLSEPTAEQTYYDLLLRDKTNYVSTTFAKARTYLEQPFDEPGLYFNNLFFNIKQKKSIYFKIFLRYNIKYF